MRAARKAGALSKKIEKAPVKGNQYTGKVVTPHSAETPTKARVLENAGISTQQEGKTNAMRLSEGERLILFMLTEIYEHLGIQNGIDSKFVQSAICDGHAWGLKRKYPGLFNIDEADQSVIGEVCNILEMWSFLESSYGQLSMADKARISTVPKFEGFGENSNHVSVASFLIQKLDRFSEFKDRKMYDYTTCSLQQHRAMLAVFMLIQASILGQLSADQIIEILEAKSVA
jgi:uncharacterized protein